LSSIDCLTSTFLTSTHLYPDLDQQRRSPITASVLSPETWPFNLKWLPPFTYLVGGNVRDALLGRHAEYLDLDFVMPSGAVETAQAIAQSHRAGFVLLDAERQIARVVFAAATVDFAQQVGPTLEADLHRRDFTVNAIAYDPWTEQLLDPLQGYADLRQHLIRMVAPENLKEDPLRLLRAYRQAAQLGFHLEPETQVAIRQLSGLLAVIAAERVQSELNYLLSTTRGTPLLDLAWQDGLLKDWLPHTTANSIVRVAQVDQAAIALTHAFPPFGTELVSWVRDQSKNAETGRNWLKIAKFACLVSPELRVAEQELWRLKYSRTEVQAVLTLLKFLPQLQQMLRSTEGSDRLAGTAREQYFFFQHVGMVFPALAVLAVAMGTTVAEISPLVERFLTPNDPICHPVPLITGRDLMTRLALPAGPRIGQLLLEIQLAQAEGKISTPAAAIDFAKMLLAGEPHA
jgi:tRNA nucleotidyltransferase (CCA-adding enzyme)